MHFQNNQQNISSRAPITTQEETSPTTSKTNVLPDATQSNPSPPVITTVPSDPTGNLSTKNLKGKTYTKMSLTGNLISVLSKNKPGFQFIEVLGQQLLSLVEETPNSTVTMKTAMLLQYLLLPKT